MKTKLLTIALSLISTLNAYTNDVITISGYVTDFEGNSIDSCVVRVLHADFSVAYSTYSDSNGYYALKNIKRGKYMALFAMRIEEYPTEKKVKEDDMRLEYWAWNIVADRDLTINPRYHRLELYGTTAFKENGGLPVIMIYTRPMSVGKYITCLTDIENSRLADMTIAPDDITFKAYIGDSPLKIRSITPIQQMAGDMLFTTYVISVDMPELGPEKYHMIRLEAFHKALGGEKGEGAYFYEVPEYK